MRGLKLDGLKNRHRIPGSFSQLIPFEPRYSLFKSGSKQIELMHGNGAHAIADHVHFKNAIQLKHQIHDRFQASTRSMHDWQWLIDSMDVLGLGFEIWDPYDRLLAFNQTINKMQANLRTVSDLGESYEKLTRKNLAEHKILTEAGKAAEWLKHRLKERRKHTGPILYALPGDHWIHSYETRTQEGFLLVVWIDVTQLIRKSRILEAINRELAHQSTTDGLTGLANRRRFDQALVAEQLLARARTMPMSLLMIDIDHFKKYNDHYGHLAGDECLRRVASLLAKCTRRSGDLVARYGGEEFVLFLPGSDTQCAREIAQECLDSLALAAIPHAASPTSKYVSFSIGIASLLPGMPLDARLLLNAADRALYRAKENGRNCFSIAESNDWKSSESGSAFADGGSTGSCATAALFESQHLENLSKQDGLKRKA